MRRAVLGLASGVVALLNINTSLSADKFFSECEGEQLGDYGPGNELRFKIKPLADGGYTGTADITSRRSGNTIDGKLSDFSVTPEKVELVLTYGGGGRLDGKTVTMSLKRDGNSLRGTGYSTASGNTRTIELECK